MVNCIQYNTGTRAKITLSDLAETLIVNFENEGPIIGEEEKQYLFQHFFRGESSKGKKGFGLGLVFIHKIINLHGGHISYSSENNSTNIFTISIPLSRNQNTEV